MAETMPCDEELHNGHCDQDDDLIICSAGREAVLTIENGVKVSQVKCLLPTGHVLHD